MGPFLQLEEVWMYFEDLKEGDAFTSLKRIITQEDINMFALAGGDKNPLHLDPEYAAQRRPFRGIIAHGELSAAIITALGAELLGYENIHSHIKTETTFVRPLKPGDSVFALMRVDKILKERARSGDIRFFATLKNQKFENVAEGTRELIILKRPR